MRALLLTEHLRGWTFELIDDSDLPVGSGALGPEWLALRVESLLAGDGWVSERLTCPAARVWRSMTPLERASERLAGCSPGSEVCG